MVLTSRSVGRGTTLEEGFWGCVERGCHVELSRDQRDGNGLGVVEGLFFDGCGGWPGGVGDEAFFALAASSHASRVRWSTGHFSAVSVSSGGILGKCGVVQKDQTKLKVVTKAFIKLDDLQYLSLNPLMHNSSS
jgi:hypothetical protein